MVLKGLSLAGLLVLIGFYLAEYLGFYSMGWVDGSFQLYVNPFTEIPVLVVCLPLLLGTWSASFVLGRNRLWTTAMVASLAGFIGLKFVLPPSGCTTVYGNRDHVMKVATLEDLRHFTRDVHRDIPDINVFHGDFSGLSGKQAEVYRKLQDAYPFMKWSLGGRGRDGPSVYERDGVLNVDWGGALPGHWGFSVAVDGGENVPYPDPDTRSLLMSNDIYFYHGD